MQELAIDVRGAVKRYGEITAVDGLDLAVPTGVCFGLLGPNGAGKSTTMRMLTAQSLPVAGEITVLGYRLPHESKQARMEMGVVPQLDNLDIELTCRQVLSVFARLYRVARHERRAAVERALGIANLAARADTKVSDLSGGMRRRLLVARGLIHRPRLVLLDELEGVEGQIARGVAGEELAAFGESLDLLVIGSRGYGPLRSLMLGTTATHLASNGRCALLVLARETD